MRKGFVALLFFVLAFAFAVSAFAASYGAAGCGLGSVVFQGRHGTVDQVLAATTNGTFGSQTFGISTGTSNCPQPQKLASNEKLNAFAQANMDNLAMDMAAGRGETLTTYVELMHVPARQRPAVYRKLQANFNKIFTSRDVQVADVIDNTAKVLSE